MRRKGDRHLCVFNNFWALQLKSFLKSPPCRRRIHLAELWRLADSVFISHGLIPGNPVTVRAELGIRGAPACEVSGVESHCSVSPAMSEISPESSFGEMKGCGVGWMFFSPCQKLSLQWAPFGGLSGIWQTISVAVNLLCAEMLWSAYCRWAMWYQI